MITDSAWVHSELTPVVKELLREAARQLTGHKRRAFLAQVTEQFFGGSARQAAGREPLWLEPPHHCPGSKGASKRDSLPGCFPRSRQPQDRSKAASTRSRRAGACGCPGAGGPAVAQHSGLHALERGGVAPGVDQRERLTARRDARRTHVKRPAQSAGIPAAGRGQEQRAAHAVPRSAGGLR
jgi:hypothetical protein